MPSRYYKTGATTWNNANNWSATSAAGSDNAGIPTALDDAIFTSSSNSACAISTTAGLCATLTTTGYGGTITLNVALTVSGNVTLGASTTFNGTGTFNVSAVTSTLTSNGNTSINCPFAFFANSNPSTWTLADNWTFNNNVQTKESNATWTKTINGNNIYCKAGFFANAATNTSNTLTTGTTVINMIGTGTFKTSTNDNTFQGGLGNPVIINTTGTITGGINIHYRTGTFTYIKGTIASNSTIRITASCSLDMNNGGLNYTIPVGFEVQSTQSPTITMLSDWYTTDVTIAGTTIINGFSLYTTGTFSCTTNTLSGTTVIRFKGSGSQSISSTSTVSNDISFEAGSNTIVIGNFSYTGRSGGSTMTYTSGTVSHSGTLTITGTNTIKFNTGNSIQFNNITASTSGMIISLSAILYVTGTFNLSSTGTYTFSGSYGFNVGILSYIQTPGTTNTGIVLNSGNTYYVTSNLNLYSPTLGTYLGIKSSSGGSVAYFNLIQGATQSIGNIQPTDINSSGGQTIWAWRPNTISNSSNWKNLSPTAMQTAYTYIS